VDVHTAFQAIGALSCPAGIGDLGTHRRTTETFPALLKVQDEERRKLARDLHDSTGQTLAALRIHVSFLGEKCNQDPSILAISSDVALGQQWCWPTSS
jgi:nitrate/nitrite-specific signal transduction histidine kinase